MLNKNSKIYVAGHNGMVGSAIVRTLQEKNYENIVLADRSDLDLLDQHKVNEFFLCEKPEAVFLAAAKVGGIFANNSYPAQFIYENLMIETNVIHAAWKSGVKRLLFLGSSCIYPKHAEQPMSESCLLTGVLESTNEPYAIAKIAGIKLCESYNRQHGTDYRSVMPTNLYGPGDNFHPENSHVIPALIRKFYEARERGDESVSVWGTGSPKREFLHVDDMAAASLHVMELPKEKFWSSVDPMVSHINVGTGVDISIRELASIIKEVTNYSGDIVFDTSKPDGTPRKLMDVSRLKSLGWSSELPLQEGLKSACAWFEENLLTLRV